MKESDFKELWKDNKTYEHVPLPKSIFAREIAFDYPEYAKE